MSTMLSVALFLISFIAAFQGGECSTITWTNPIGGTGSAPTAIAEGTAAGTIGYTATASSDGTPAVVTLTMAAGGLFSIASDGSISTTAITDYETSPTHVILITAIDNDCTAFATSTATLTISITNLATDPTFPALTYCVTAADKFAASSTLGTYAASDPGGAALAYTATGNTNTDFAVSSVGVIIVAKTLDRSTTSLYTLVIKAANAVPISATTTVVVCVGTSSQCAVCAASSSGGVAITSSIMTILALLLMLLR